jgi:hypothetical protein
VVLPIPPGGTLFAKSDHALYTKKELSIPVEVTAHRGGRELLCCQQRENGLVMVKVEIPRGLKMCWVT